MTETNLSPAFYEKALKEQKDMETTFLTACKEADLDKLSNALKKYSDVFKVNDLIDGAPLITHLLQHMGTRQGLCGKLGQTKECIELLVGTYKANVNRQDEKERFPLDYFVHINSETLLPFHVPFHDVVRYILLNGGTIDKAKRNLLISRLKYWNIMPPQEFLFCEACGLRRLHSVEDAKRNDLLLDQMIYRQSIRKAVMKAIDLKKEIEDKIRKGKDLKKELAEVNKFILDGRKELGTTTPERLHEMEEVMLAARKRPDYLPKLKAMVQGKPSFVCSDKILKRGYLFLKGKKPQSR